MGVKHLKCSATLLALNWSRLWLVIHHCSLTREDFERSKTKPLNLELYYSVVVFANASASIKATCAFLDFRLMLASFGSSAGPLPLLRDEKENERC